MTGVPVTPTSGVISPKPAPTKLPVVPEGTEVSELLPPCAASIRFACHNGVQGVVLTSASKAYRLSCCVATNATLRFYAADSKIGHPQRLRINGTIDRAREELAESGVRYVGRRNSVFPRIAAVTGEIVVIGEDAGEVCDTYRLLTLLVTSLTLVAVRV